MLQSPLKIPMLPPEFMNLKYMAVFLQRLQPQRQPPIPTPTPGGNSYDALVLMDNLVGYWTLAPGIWLNSKSLLTNG